MATRISFWREAFFAFIQMRNMLSQHFESLSITVLGPSVLSDHTHCDLTSAGSEPTTRRLEGLCYVHVSFQRRQLPGESLGVFQWERRRDAYASLDACFLYFPDCLETAIVARAKRLEPLPDGIAVRCDRHIH